VADEETKNLEETVDEAVETAEEESSASAGADATPAADESSSAEADGSSVDGAESGEPEEQLSPKERRRKTKAGRNRKPKYTGTLEERRAQRDVHRKKKAVQRRAHRAKQREEHKAAGPREGTPPVVKEPGVKKVQQGTVVSSKTDKTIIVQIQLQESHRVYQKVVRHTKKLVAHDELNDAGDGDVVRVIESRPLSRTKRWRLVEIVERAK
jgi:small subunit ribosomal protein S17